MWQFIRSSMLTVIIFIGAAHGILVVGPKFFRANQDYTVVISNFKLNISEVGLMIRMEGRSNDDRSVLNSTKSVDVRRNMNKVITFKMPADLSAGNYKLTINGQRGFGYHQEVPLVYLGKSISGLIQIDKPVYKQGDTVKFRVIVLDTELKPPARVKSVHVTLRDPQNKVIREWTSGKLNAGVFENDIQLAPSAMFGMWKISVQVDGEELASRTFEIKEYVLSSFDIEVIPSGTPLMEHRGLNLTIAANYHFRKPVKGLAKVELYLEDDMLDQQKEVEVYGMRQVELRFVGHFDEQEHQKDVFVKTTFIEQHTNRSVAKGSHITMYKYKYRVDLIKDIPYFHPGHPFKCALQLRYHDGTPAKGITGKVIILDIEYEKTVTTDDNGLIKLELSPGNNVQEMVITLENDDGFYFDETVQNTGVVSNAYIKLELKSTLHLNRLVQVQVSCNEPMTFFVYYVMKKGNIIDSGFITTNEQSKYPLRFIASEKMIPQVKIIVSTVKNDRMMFDFLDLDFEEPRHKIRLNLNKQEVKPGQQIELSLSGQRGSYVGLVAYNKGLMYDNKNKDLFWEDIMRVYKGIGPSVENEFDKFHSMGLFVKTLNDIEFNEAHDMSARVGHQIVSNAISKTVSYRTHFPESWLWQNVTLGKYGTHKMIETVPDMMTSWYLTGFSIHPEYGLGIIKEPVQLTTAQSFYIVENLPYSIKREEAVVLQFTLFHNLGGEYIADVTLYTVANQTEFVGRPVEDLSYTKSVSVPPKVGVPVSFLVKARKLGEMTVRIEATINTNQESDALEKVIRVVPESLVQPKMKTLFFCFDSYINQTILMNLDFNKQADNGSRKIEFRLNPDLHTNVVDNLDNLLAPSSGNGEQNMVKFVPNIVVRDYLHAIGSKDQSLLHKATNLLRQGYHNQMRYHQTDGSFGAYQNATGSVFLTAFVAKSMQMVSKYIDVDTVMVEKVYDWLASKQHSSGRFDEVGSVIHKGMLSGLRNGISLTSYVLIALLENENAKVKHAVVIQNSINYLSGHVENIEHPYDLSIVTYALMLNGHSMKKMALEKLVGMATPLKKDGKLYLDTENSIETTAYALLSIVLAEKYVDGIPVMRWLVNQRYVTGSFPRTQDTFVGLKALTKLAEKVSPLRNDYAIQLKGMKALIYGFKQITITENLHIKPEDIYVQNNRDIPEDTEWLEINIAGIGFGMLQVIYEYSLNLNNFDKRLKLDLEKQNTGSNYELLLEVCAKFDRFWSNGSLHKVMIEVTFPSGYEVDQNPVKELTNINPIHNIEVRYGGTSVVVYYYNMSIERNCFTVTAYRRGKVAMKRPAYVVAYGYYDRNYNAIEMYEVDEQPDEE
ncbi:thioester-containing protein 1 allele S3-like [Anopheles moucheti]|uniref:thioester-containing protein 1 allele S3-like n=1 Tax=Anopheles moucheti TaxID=186751 RepID=UPI0022EFFFF9|nr:thioester-containing protein 1 allele S3-like [Anopheles moucheti]